MKRLFLILCTVLLFFGISRVAPADMIDFEAGFLDLEPLGAVTTATNTVTFGVGENGPTGNAYVAQVGAPITAFFQNDSPEGTTAGDFFLTDQNDQSLIKLNYFITFDTPVLNLSLDLYDFRVESQPFPFGPVDGDTATLTVYADLFGEAVGTDVFMITAGLVDGNVADLAVMNAFPVLSASLVFSDKGDVGTGIDNIAFSTAPVPEPATFFLLASGLVGLVGLRKKRKQNELFRMQVQ